MKVIIDLKLPSNEIIMFTSDSVSLTERMQLQGMLTGQSFMRVDGNGNMIGRRNRYSIGGGNGTTLRQGILSPRGSMPAEQLGGYGTDEYDETKSVRSAGRSLSIQINNVNSVKK